MRLSKRDRLEIGAAVAPVLRDVSARPKRVHITDRDGKEVGRIDRVELSRRMLIREGIDIDTPPGQRPKAKSCATCGVWYRVPERGRIVEWCIRCFADRYRCTGVVGGKRCAERLTKKAWAPSSVKQRRGLPPKCRRCANAARTPEQRSEAARKRWSAKTPEQRSDAARKAQSAKTPEQRSESTRKANAAKTPEQRSDAARKAQSAKTPEQRSDAARKANAAKTPEQRSEAIRKAWQARRSKRAR